MLQVYCEGLSYSVIIFDFEMLLARVVITLSAPPPDKVLVKKKIFDCMMVIYTITNSKLLFLNCEWELTIIKLEFKVSHTITGERGVESTNIHYNSIWNHWQIRQFKIFK